MGVGSWKQPQDFLCFNAEAIIWAVQLTIFPTIHWILQIFRPTWPREDTWTTYTLGSLLKGFYRLLFAANTTSETSISCRAFYVATDQASSDPIPVGDGSPLCLVRGWFQTKIFTTWNGCAVPNCVWVTVWVVTIKLRILLTVVCSMVRVIIYSMISL